MLRVSFIRFLPCNSHHIRDSNLNQQQQNQQTQTIQIRPVRRAVSLDRNSVRQPPTAHIHIPARFSNTGPPLPPRGRRFVVGGTNNITEDELNHRFSLFGIQFTLRDLDNLAPSFYNAQRNNLRSFLRQNFFNNIEINDEIVSVAIRDMLIAVDLYLSKLTRFYHQDYDVRKSIENLIMKSLPFIINLITDDDSSDFGSRIERQLITFCENVYMILVKCIGSRETENYLNEIANEIIIGRTENVGNLRRFSREIIHRFLIDRRSYDLSEIQEFLIIKRPSAPTVSQKMISIFQNSSKNFSLNSQSSQEKNRAQWKSTSLSSTPKCWLRLKMMMIPIAFKLTIYLLRHCFLLTVLKLGILSFPQIGSR